MAHSTISKRLRRLSSISTGDADADTDGMLLRGQKTLSKGRLRRMKVMSTLTGNSQPTRKKIFSTVQLDSDYKLYSITVHNKVISCIKIYNPLLLEKNLNIWTALESVHRFEMEDPEGIVTTIPKHYATSMPLLESFSITWTRVKSLPIEMFHEGLRTLSLQRNNIKTLNGIEKAVNLSSLDVSSNLLMELPSTFGQLQSLNTLNISGNAIKELPTNFGSLTQLRTLDCSCNRLNLLPNSLCNLIELLSLDVGNNNLTELPATFVDLLKLEDLRAQVNHLESLPARFDQLTKLSSLNLRKNKFTEVPPQLSSMLCLQTLNMKDNLIKTIPVAIPSLKTLMLDSNHLDEMSDGLVNCSNLQMLSLQNNKIVAIPAKIKSLSNLRVLHLSRNDIEEVPEEIGELEHLRHLNLQATQIQTLPTAITTMSKLVKLDISECPQLQDYLRLAYKEGGLAKLREELPIQNKAVTRRECSNCEDNSTAADGCNSEAVLRRFKRATMISDDLIKLIGETPQDHQIPSIESLDSLDSETVGEIDQENLDIFMDNGTSTVQMRKKGPPTRPKSNKEPENSKLIIDTSVELQESNAITTGDNLTTSKRQSHV